MSAVLDTLNRPIKFVNDQIDRVMDPYKPTFQKHYLLCKYISVIMMAGGFYLTCKTVGHLWLGNLHNNIPKPISNALEKLSERTFLVALPFFMTAAHFVFNVSHTPNPFLVGFNLLLAAPPVAIAVAIVASGVLVYGVTYGTFFLVPFIPGIALSILGKKLYDKTQRPEVINQ